MKDRGYATSIAVTPMIEHFPPRQVARLRARAELLREKSRRACSNAVGNAFLTMARDLEAEALAVEALYSNELTGTSA